MTDHTQHARPRLTDEQSNSTHACGQLASDDLDCCTVSAWWYVVGWSKYALGNLPAVRAVHGDCEKKLSMLSVRYCVSIQLR